MNTVLQKTDSQVHMLYGILTLTDAELIQATIAKTEEKQKGTIFQDVSGGRAVMKKMMKICGRLKMKLP